MTGRVNSGGSKPVEAFAAISVTYPAGTICTCAQGDVVLQAPDTSGTALFQVPAGGMWTIMLDAGSWTDVRQVTVAKNGVYNVTFFPNLDDANPTIAQLVRYLEQCGFVFNYYPFQITPNGDYQTISHTFYRVPTDMVAVNLDAFASVTTGYPLSIVLGGNFGRDNDNNRVWSYSATSATANTVKPFDEIHAIDKLFAIHATRSQYGGMRNCTESTVQLRASSSGTGMPQPGRWILGARG